MLSKVDFHAFVQLLLAIFNLADWEDPNGKLLKPALTNNLDYLEAGNVESLPITSSSMSLWDSPLVPYDCKYHAMSNFQLDAKDLLVYNVTYNDCEDPWVICRHKDSPVSITVIVDNFGRMPVHMRDWVRHVMSFPNPSGASAYNSDGNLVLSDTAPRSLDIFLHETGHSLDGLGAVNGLPNTTFSGTQVWTNAYTADDNVPDNYAQTNHLEDFAQNTVVAVYDTVVKGGLASVQPKWQALSHQFGLIKRRVPDIKPGGTCKRHLTPSDPVNPNSDLYPEPASHPPYNLPPVSGNATAPRVVSRWFKRDYDVVHEPRRFSTKYTCRKSHFFGTDK